MKSLLTHSKTPQRRLPLDLAGYNAPTSSSKREKELSGARGGPAKFCMGGGDLPAGAFPTRVSHLIVPRVARSNRSEVQGAMYLTILMSVLFSVVCSALKSARFPLPLSVRTSQFTLRATPSDVLYDMPVSNHGARCRMIVKAKGIEGSEVIVQPPSSLGGLQSEQYKKLNPNGKMPLLLTEFGYPIAESDTICRYLIEKYAAKDPSFVPGDARLRVLSEQIVRQHDIYITPIQGAMYKAPGYVFSTFGSDRGKALDDLLKQLATIESMLETFDQVHPNLRRGGYLCGDSISLADATLFPTMIFFQFMLPRFFDVPVPGRILNDWYKSIGSQNEAAYEVKMEIEGALREWESNKRWDPIIEEKQRAGASGAGWGRQLTAALLIGSSPFLIDPICKMDGNLINFVANADSTGKMSTKLTARKRYLPRIVAGVKEFEAVAKSPKSSPESDLFLLGKDSQSASLVRAMRLYGASLRKGEVPDAISREADELCSSFQKDIDIFSKSRSTQDAEKADKSLRAYLTFAKID